MVFINSYMCNQTPDVSIIRNLGIAKLEYSMMGIDPK
jgi:hypothetical protein